LRRSIERLPVGGEQVDELARRSAPALGLEAAEIGPVLVLLHQVVGRHARHDTAPDIGDLERCRLALLAIGRRQLLDLLEVRDALALAARYKMSEVFGCARMVLGPVPELPDAEIFGVTTFELG